MGRISLPYVHLLISSLTRPATFKSEYDPNPLKIRYNMGWHDTGTTWTQYYRIKTWYYTIKPNFKLDLYDKKSIFQDLIPTKFIIQSAGSNLIKTSPQLKTSIVQPKVKYECPKTYLKLLEVKIQFNEFEWSMCWIISKSTRSK